MSDRVFRLIGLNGKAVLPMVLGLGCDTMATLTTRILETRKERVHGDAAPGARRALLGPARRRSSAMLAAVPLAGGRDLVRGASSAS